MDAWSLSQKNQSQQAGGELAPEHQVFGTRVVGKRVGLPPVEVIDSHTGGEPTRVVVSGAPDLALDISPTGDGAQYLQRQIELLKNQFDSFRRAVILEPRGNDVMVGALLLPPTSPDCVCSVIFFNNVGYLGMCGHGMIGLMATLFYLGKVGVGRFRVQTPVGIVQTTVHSAHSITVQNVASYRWRSGVSVSLAESPTDPAVVTGDIAWGGNWFFLVADHGQALKIENVRQLTDFAIRIRQGLERAGITGRHGSMIDHIELLSDSTSNANSRNFVLCPGLAYDRSPCGTGTSAKLACLAADGKWLPAQTWIQESITGSRFEASYQPLAENADAGECLEIIPEITGSAYVCGKTTLMFDEDDPFRLGIGA